MNISFLCGGGGPQYEWADPLVETGIGGSEECLIYLARALARRGHRVRVYNNCGSLASIYHDVTYIPFIVQPYPSEDLLVAWRDWTLLCDKSAKQKWMWSHDQPVGNHAPAQENLEMANQTVDAWILLNKAHRERYILLRDEQVGIIPIGVEQSQKDGLFEAEFINHTNMRERGRVIYFSEPARGLDELRNLWRQVRVRAPFATLAAFWWDESKFLPPDEKNGILPMQKLGPREVIGECMRASVWAYPCTFEGEISPATAIKAQLAGAVPCVIPRGGLRDLVHLGVTTDRAHFANMLGDLLVQEKRQDNFRYQMMQLFKSYPAWDEIAEMWMKEYEKRMGRKD